jgi:hypothetical protein
MKIHKSKFRLVFDTRIYLNTIIVVQIPTDFPKKREGAILIWGKIYYMIDFPLGERLLYSQFSGGKAAMGENYYTTPVPCRSRCGM